MTTGTFWNPVTGEGFEAEIEVGSFTVTHKGHVIPVVTTLDGAEKSHETCPVCGKSFEVDLAAGPDVPILTFETNVGGEDTSFAGPYGGCVVGNNIVVIDSGKGRLVAYNLDLTYWDRYKFTGNGAIASAARRACYSNGKLYITGTAYVQIYDVVLDDDDKISSITYNTRFGGVGSGDGQFATIATGICTDGTYLYVCDDTGHRIQKFTMAGAFVAKIGSLGTGDDQFNRPWGITYSAGKLYVAEYGGLRVNVRLASDLSYVGKFGSSGTGDGQFAGGTLYSITNDGSYIYVMQTTRVQKFLIDSPYTFQAKIGSLGAGNDQFNNAFDIQYINSKLLVFDVGNLRIKYHLTSDLSYDSKVGGAGSVLPTCAPLINFPASYAGALLKFDDGEEFSLLPDTHISKNGYNGYTPKTPGPHTVELWGVPLSDIKYVDSNNVSGIPNAWDLYQDTPIASHGAFAYVWFDGSIYHEYYPYDNYTKFGHATSADGLTWTVDDAHNPVMVIGPGTYDNISLAVPCVWKEGSTWYMLYRGNGFHTCLATSADGLTWTKYASNPVIPAQPDPAGIIKVGSTYYLFTNSTGGNRSVNVYTSTDLHAWTKQTPDPLFAGGRFCSCPFKYGGKYYLLVSKYMGETLTMGGLELFESDDPTFLNATLLGYVLSQSTPGRIIDTPCVVTNTVFRDTFPGNRLMCYFSMGAPNYYLYLTIQNDIAAAIASAVNPLQDGVLL